ncbi:MAG: phenylalanine--tRNA ligase subunit beta [Rhodospirillaceae bacterium]
MKFSEHWLRSLCNPPLATQALADTLTFGGIEVELLEPVAPAFDNVVVGEVLSVTKHPDADRLNLCEVAAGDQKLSIVCGAPNVRVGMKAPVALVGAQLPGGLAIKKAKVRGVESQGMLCSAKELGLSEEASGLLALSPDAKSGDDIRTVLDLDDTLFTTKPTPNRGDCLSILGMAREVAALTRTALKPPHSGAVEASTNDTLRVELAAPEACPLYCGRLVRSVRADTPTPDWMIQRLTRSGVRSISAIVDITNYVMLELGQPLHAFDAAKLKGGITVRYARSGEPITLLNGETRELTPSYLVIADDAHAVALAGIMGGAATAVDAKTQDIFLESAYFEPAVIAGKSRELGFGSDSSYRFERGVDFGATRAGLERATALVLEICGGEAGPITEAVAKLPRRAAVPLRLPRVQRLLGIEIEASEAEEILSRLGCEIVRGADHWLVTPPTYRFDISIEEDLIEELVRVYGYDRVPATIPEAAASMLPLPEATRSNAAIRHLMADRDYQEVVTYSFVDRAWEEDYCSNRAPVALANPIASHMSVMRSSLFGGLVDCVAFNARHKQTRVRVFEIGRCFSSARGGVDQPWRLGGVAYGAAVDEQWGSDGRKVDFYDVKSDVEALFAPRELRFEAAAHPALHPGKSARVLCDGVAAGWLGELHPRWQQKYDLPSAPVLFELDWDVLRGDRLPAYAETSRFPPVRRDMALVFDEETPYQEVMDALNARKPPIVAHIGLFDVYRGSDLGKGRKSLAFRVLLQDTRKTLTDAEVESAVAQLREILQQQFNAKLR